eukprot:2760800-Ditylum_brightwellii.AAC.1
MRAQTYSPNLHWESYWENSGHGLDGTEIGGTSWMWNGWGGQPLAKLGSFVIFLVKRITTITAPVTT